MFIFTYKVVLNLSVSAQRYNRVNACYDFLNTTEGKIFSTEYYVDLFDI